MAVSLKCRANANEDGRLQTADSSRRKRSGNTSAANCRLLSAVSLGYENHGKVDDEFKLIRGYGVTDAAVHDSVPYLDVMSEEPTYPDQEAFADAAYVGERIDAGLKELGYLPMICEKGYRNKPLTEQQKQFNKVKSSVRCRVEHVFGEMKMRMGNEILRSIGFARARFWIGMRNLMYNMSRFVSLNRPKKVPKVAKVR